MYVIEKVCEGEAKMRRLTSCKGIPLPWPRFVGVSHYHTARVHISGCTMYLDQGPYVPGPGPRTVRATGKFDLVRMSTEAFSRSNTSVRMPRKPPRASAVEAAQNFARFAIAESNSEDFILPKNGVLACMQCHAGYCLRACRLSFATLQ